MRNIAPPQQRYWKERYAEMLERPSEKAYGDAVESAPLHTPGQHLHAVFVAHFQGGGWVEAPDWEDFDEAGQAEWEAMSLVIGRNLRAARAAPEMLEALKLADAALSGANMNMRAVETKVRAALAKATPPAADTEAAE